MSRAVNFICETKQKQRRLSDLELEHSRKKYATRNLFAITERLLEDNRKIIDYKKIELHKQMKYDSVNSQLTLIGLYQGLNRLFIQYVCISHEFKESPDKK